MANKIKTLEWNLNEPIYVKLTDRGRYIHRDRHEVLQAFIHDKGGKGFSYSPPREDSEGWCQFQGWELMQVFGPYMGMGTESVCDLNVKIESSLK